MLMLFGLTISAPLPHGVTTRVRLRATFLTCPGAAGWAAGARVGAGAAGGVVGCAAVAAAVVGAACAGVVGFAAGPGRAARWRPREALAVRWCMPWPAAPDPPLSA